MNGFSKVTENLLRRAARRQGYDLSKNRSRDPMAQHFGLYQLNDIDTEQAYLDRATGAVWLSPQTLARALGHEEIATNGLPGHAVDERGSDEDIPLPVVALKLVPGKSKPISGQSGWVVETQTGGGVIATLLLSDERARELAEKILRTLGEQRTTG
jgi:hypothetical protein